MLKSSGPKIDPCGSPDRMSLQELQLFLILVLSFPFVK